MKMIKKYNDNKTIKIKSSKQAHIKVYKCSYLDCDCFYFNKKDVNDHILYKHGEMPVNWKITPDKYSNNNNFYNRDRINLMNGKIQKQIIRHTLLVIGVDINKIKKPMTERIKKWLNERQSSRIKI